MREFMRDDRRVGGAVAWTRRARAGRIRRVAGVAKVEAMRIPPRFVGLSRQVEVDLHPVGTEAIEAPGMAGVVVKLLQVVQQVRLSETGWSADGVGHGGRRAGIGVTRRSSRVGGSDQL